MRKSEHIITFRHYIVLTVIAFAAGIILATTVKSKFLMWSTRLLFILLTVLAIIAITLKIINRKKGVSVKPFVLSAFLTFCMLAGIFRIVGENYIFPNPLYHFAGKSAWLTGTVDTEPIVTEKGYTSYFQMSVMKINDAEIASKKITIFIPKERGDNLSKGDSICCWGEIRKPTKKSPTWPYDYETHLQGTGIFFSGSTKHANPVEPEKAPSISSAISEIGYRTSGFVVSAIDQIPISSPTNANILKGILVGDKTNFSDQLYQQFSYAGLSHIVAVSGMHLSILFGVITYILSTLKIKKRFSVFIIIPIVILFAATANFTPSVCRAAIMIIMMLIAILFRKRYSPINALFLSLGIILMVFPYSIYSRSLTLSFCATLGILVYYKYISYFLKKLVSPIKVKSEGMNHILSYLINTVVSSIAISISVTIATAFFSLKLFGMVSWIQFFTNIWIIPSVTVVFCLGFLASITYYIFPPVAYVLTYPLNFFLNVISKTAETFGQNQFTYQLDPAKLPWKGLVICVGIAIFIYLILKTAYDLCEETEKAKPLPAYLSKPPKIPKL